MSSPIISIISFLGSVISLAMMVYTLFLHVKIKKMQEENQIFSSYIKEESFLLMKNGGDDPCDTQKKIVMPNFSQESDYIVRR